MTWDNVSAARTDFIVVAPCGFDTDAAVDQAKLALPHLLEATVWAIDADGLVARPGPRLIDGVAALAAILHPDLAGPPHPAAARIVAQA